VYDTVRHRFLKKVAINRTLFLTVKEPKTKNKKKEEKMGSEFHLRATLDSDLDNGGNSSTRRPPRIKPPPQSSAISAPFSYSPSDDGTDENLLILLHGLGSHAAFFCRR
jgi:hypothetical protein